MIESHVVYLGEDRPPLTEGEEGGVGEASLAAGDVDTDGGVEESTLEPEGAASSESPLGRSHRSVVRPPSGAGAWTRAREAALEASRVGRVACVEGRILSLLAGRTASFALF